MFIFRNWKPHPLRCSQNTCACLVQKGLQLGDALLTRATSNSGEQKSLVWQSQTAKISQDHLRSAKFPPILGAALLSPSGNPAPPTHVLWTAPGDAQPSAQRTRGTRGTWRLACSSASSAFCLVSQPQNIREKWRRIWGIGQSWRSNLMVIECN